MQSNKFVFHKEADGRVFPFPAQRGNVSLELEPKVYSVGYHREMGFFLKPEESFKLPEKVYGNINTNVNRFFRSFELNNKNLGVLLRGLSGSGKTITLKAVSVKAIEMGYPVILINECFGGQSFLDFINSIQQNAVVMFDEFDKVYSERGNRDVIEMSLEQNTVLTLLDGVSSGNKKMYIFTINSVRNMSEYLFNRPSRIRYNIEFNGIETETLVDFLTQNLKNYNEESVRAFIHLARCPNPHYNFTLSFDSMCEFVKEMNQFGESLDDVLKIMNPGIESSQCSFEVTVHEEGKEPYKTDGTGIFNGTIMGENKAIIQISLRIPTDSPDNKIYTPDTVILGDSNFVGFGSEFDTIEFENNGKHFSLRYSRQSVSFPVVYQQNPSMREGNGLTHLQNDRQDGYVYGTSIASSRLIPMSQPGRIGSM